MRGRVIVAAAILLATSARADDTAALDVNAAVRAALAHAPDREIAAGRMDIARAGLAEARAGYLPDVNLAVSGSAGFGGSVTAAMGVRGIMGSPFTESFGAGVEGSWVAYDFGRRERRLDAARAGVDVARALGSLDRRAIALRAVDAFARAADAQARTVHAQALLELRRRGAAQARTLAEAGLRPTVEARLAEARALDGDAALEQARADEAGARARLSAALGTGVRVAAPLSTDAPSDAEIMDAMRAPDDRPDPLHDVAVAEQARAHALGRAATAEHLPRLVVAGSAGYARHDPDPRFWAAGGAVVMPLFSYARERARARAAMGEARIRSAEGERASLELRASLDALRDALAATRRGLTAARAGVAAADASLAAAEARYEGGFLSFIEVDQARTQLADARLREAEIALALATEAARVRALGQR